MFLGESPGDVEIGKHAFGLGGMCFLIVCNYFLWFNLYDIVVVIYLLQIHT